MSRLKDLYVKVPVALFEQFKLVCDDSFQSISEAIRSLMLEHVRKDAAMKFKWYGNERIKEIESAFPKSVTLNDVTQDFIEQFTPDMVDIKTINDDWVKTNTPYGNLQEFLCNFAIFKARKNLQ